MVVKVGAAESDIYHINMGVPQGSVIAPILFVIMLHDMNEAVTTSDVFLSVFADDVAIVWHARKLLQTPKKKVASHLPRGGQFHWKIWLRLSTGYRKTTALVFTRHICNVISVTGGTSQSEDITNSSHHAHQSHFLESLFNRTCPGLITLPPSSPRLPGQRTSSGLFVCFIA